MEFYLFNGSLILGSDLFYALITSAVAISIKPLIQLIKRFAFSSPFIMVKLSNGSELKLSYDGKSESETTKKLLDLVSRGEVISIKFVS